MRKARTLAAAALCAVLVLGAVPAVAHEPHDPQRSGHSLRILAYFVHPVGWLIDTLFFRPAHWVVNREPVRTVVGHTD